MEGREHDYDCIEDYEGPKQYIDMASQSNSTIRKPVSENKARIENTTIPVKNKINKKFRLGLVTGLLLLTLIFLNVVLVGLVSIMMALQSEATPCTHLKQVAVYTQEVRNDTFLYAAKKLTALDELSICMWLYTEVDDDEGFQDWIISLAVKTGIPSKIIYKANEFAIGFEAKGDITLLRNGHGIYDNLNKTTEEYNKRLLGWKKHCFTWKKSGNMRWYTGKVYDSSVMELWIDVVDTSEQAIDEGARLVVLQDQDKPLGGFETSQTWRGRVALINMWDYELTEEEVGKYNCYSKGNLLTMDDMEISGPASFTEQLVPCCQ